MLALLVLGQLTCVAHRCIGWLLIVISHKDHPSSVQTLLTGSRLAAGSGTTLTCSTGSVPTFNCILYNRLIHNTPTAYYTTGSAITFQLHTVQQAWPQHSNCIWYNRLSHTIPTAYGTTGSATPFQLHMVQHAHPRCGDNIHLHAMQCTCTTVHVQCTCTT